jgi:D-threonate/D-erythronate kinase
MALRLLADDLTGALDAAACFVPLAGPVPTFWKPPLRPHRTLPWPAAIDAGTRALPEAAARVVTGSLASLLDDADLAFKTLDSMLRGHPAAEIAACANRFDHCIVAPACPAQGRVMRCGSQMVREANGWREGGIDLPAALRREGIDVTLCRPGDAAPVGVSLFDAESEDDLRTVVVAGQELRGRVLWCGSTGLAGAFASAAPAVALPLPTPILALVGSNHPVSIAQLSAAWAYVYRIAHGSAEEAAPIARRLESGNAAVAVVVPPNTERTSAAHIERCFGALLPQLDPPGTLLAAGGDTLRLICDLLEARYLEVDGEITPGVPISVMHGGPWDGVVVLSKSGAFGDTGLLLRLLREPRDGGAA